jgi:hypothetical protein
MGGHRPEPCLLRLVAAGAVPVLAPGEGIGVVAFTNTGPFSPIAATAPVTSMVLRGLLSLPVGAVRTDVPEQPWVWASCVAATTR